MLPLRLLRGAVSDAVASWSVTPSNLPAGYTFTRATPATQVNADGSLTQVASGTLRTADYSVSIASGNPQPGIKIEQQATNTYLNSGSPATQSISVTAGSYTISAYGHASGPGTITLSGAASGVITTGTNPSHAYRQALTVTCTTGTLTLTVSGRPDAVQVETGSVATSYIPTAGSQVTRAADSLSWATSAIDRWSLTTGLLVLDYVTPTAEGSSTGVLSVDNTTGLLYRNSGVWKTYDGVVSVGTPTSQFSAARNRVAIGWSPGQRVICANGYPPARGSASFGPAPTLYVLRAFGVQDAGTIYRLDYYPQAVNDTTLQRLTA